MIILVLLYNINMDLEKKKRLQSMKVIASEALMVISIIIMVIVLAFIVSGYWLKSDFTVERQGLLQISSSPTGADVIIDDTTSWLQKTNTSKVLPSGKHTVTLAKDGYDTWTKTISISEGLVYKLDYPRLFLNNRYTEEIADISGTIVATLPFSHRFILLTDNTTEWRIIQLDTEEPEMRKLNIAEAFPSTATTEDSQIGLLKGNIVSIEWARDDTHALFHIKGENEDKWILFNIKEPAKSVDITKQFGSSFDKLTIIDYSANTLLAEKNGDLQRINVPGKTISTVLVSNVVSYDCLGSEVIFSAMKQSSNGLQEYYIGTLKDGDDEVKEYATMAEPSKVAMSKFYDGQIIAVLEGQTLSIHQKEAYDDYSEFKLSFKPEEMKADKNGKYVFLSSGVNLSTLDLEAMSLTEWSLNSDKYGWLDGAMIYSIEDGELGVYDFDGLNHRILSKNVSSHFPVFITDNKWLYYISDGSLVREWLVER